jgi:hypothetical protein
MSQKTPWTTAGTGPADAPGIAGRACGVLKAAWAALVTGSRTIPFGDNGNLFRDLAAQIAASRRRG